MWQHVQWFDQSLLLCLSTPSSLSNNSQASDLRPLHAKSRNCKCLLVLVWYHFLLTSPLYLPCQGELAKSWIQLSRVLCSAMLYIPSYAQLPPDLPMHQLCEWGLWWRIPFYYTTWPCQFDSLLGVFTAIDLGQDDILHLLIRAHLQINVTFKPTHVWNQFLLMGRNLVQPWINGFRWSTVNLNINPNLILVPLHNYILRFWKKAVWRGFGSSFNVLISFQGLGMFAKELVGRAARSSLWMKLSLSSRKHFPHKHIFTTI